MTAVRWAKQALADRETIFCYLFSEAGLEVASAADEKFVALVRLVQDNPMMGRVAGVKANQRKVALARLPFILTYVIEDDGIAILRLLHTSRRVAGHINDSG